MKIFCIAGDPEPDECGTRRRKASSKYTELSRLTRGLIVIFELPEHSLFPGLLPAMAKKRTSSVSVCVPLKKKKLSEEGGPSGARSVVHVLSYTSMRKS